MTTTIGIIGLGQIGASVGLRLKARASSEHILGHDRDGRVERAAEAMGAVDSTASLRDIAKKAQIIFLCLPLSEIREILSRVGPDLQEGTVVVETAPVKAQVLQWVEESLPAGRHYIGLVPSISASMLVGSQHGIQAADADLFARTTMMVVTTQSTPEGVEQLGMNIARVLGAKPMLTDPVEADGIMTTAHLLPQLTSAALIEACVATGGWTEARKLASRPYTSVTGGMAYFDDPDSVEIASMSNPRRVAQGLDVIISALKGLRDHIEQRDAAGVGERLKESYSARQLWLEERNSAAWLTEGNEPVDLPGLGEYMTQMLFGGRIAEASRDLDKKRTLKR